MVFCGSMSSGLSEFDSRMRSWPAEIDRTIVTVVGRDADDALARARAARAALDWED